MPNATRSQPRPSFGNTRSIGAPFALFEFARYSNEIPTTNSPCAAWLHGFEPECVYCAMLSCSLSMYSQPPFSPQSVSHAVTSKKPVPDDAGLGITTWPLYTGFVRSLQVSGLGMLRFFASTVLKQTVAPQTSIPHHAGGFFVSRYLVMIESRLIGAYGSSIPFRSSSARLEAATPITASACGFAFSGGSFAVMTPVESRTQRISTSGTSL